MKKILSFSVIVSILVIDAGCSHQLAPAGHYQNETIVVDGNTDDWSLPLRFSNPDYTMHYSVTNDDRNIYICVYSSNPSYQKKMLKNGMSIYFDTKGEKNKTCALIFPIKKMADPADNTYGNPIRNSDYQSAMAQLLLQSDYYNTTGFTNMENGQYDVKATQTDIRVAIKEGSDSSLVYEASVPIRYVTGKDLAAGMASGNFSVGIVLNAADAPHANRGNAGQSSHGGNSMGGMHGGMGGSRHYAASRSVPQKTEENWYVFRLVNKQKAS